jgi:hypothetical protein
MKIIIVSTIIPTITTTSILFILSLRAIGDIKAKTYD